MKELLKKIKLNFKFDYYLFSANNLSLTEKISFFFRKYISILTNKRKILYLGSNFHYDSRLTPALLETYPKEISDLNKIVSLSKIKSVLDIGANIGQFSYTLKKGYPSLSIYSFEPNKEIFPILQKNLKNFQNLNVYNLGLGEKDEQKTFYFSPEASAEGSFYQENIHQNYHRENMKKTRVKIINLSKNLKKLSLPRKYDLVKVDVEGAEMEVLKSLKNIDFNYLCIEVSIKRKGSGTLKDITSFLAKHKKGKPKLLYLAGMGRDIIPPPPKA